METTAIQVRSPFAFTVANAMRLAKGKSRDKYVTNPLFRSIYLYQDGLLMATDGYSLVYDFWGVAPFNIIGLPAHRPLLAEPSSASLLSKRFTEMTLVVPTATDPSGNLRRIQGGSMNLRSHRKSGGVSTLPATYRYSPDASDLRILANTRMEVAESAPENATVALPLRRMGAVLRLMDLYYPVNEYHVSDVPFRPINGFGMLTYGKDRYLYLSTPSPSLVVAFRSNSNVIPRKELRWSR